MGGKIQYFHWEFESKFTSLLPLSECVEDMENVLPDSIANEIKQHLEGLDKEF